MRHKSLVIFLVFFTFLLQLPDSQAQKIQKNFNIKWTENITCRLDEENEVRCLSFEGAVYGGKYETLPLFVSVIPMDKAYESYDISVSDIRYSNLDETDKKLVPNNYPFTFLNIEVETKIEKHKPYAVVSFVPIVKNGNGASKVISLSLSLAGKGEKSLKRGSYKPHSVLQYGSWYKISVAADGLYKVTFDDLAALGISAPVPSDKLSLFGNGGAMLPEAAGLATYDDLEENSIEIFDGGDGTFGQGDYFIFYAKGPHSWRYSEPYFTHSYNIFSDASYYFINTDGAGEGKRVKTEDNTAMTANVTVDTYTYRDFKEQDVKNFAETGRFWVWDIYDVTTTRKYDFYVSDILAQPASVVVSAAAVAPMVSAFAISVGQHSIGSLTIPKAGSNYASAASNRFSFVPDGSATVSVTLSYNKPTASSAGYLDYIELQALCALKFHTGQFSFRTPAAVGAGNVAEYQISGAQSNLRVWDVTEPTAAKALKGELSGGTLKVKADASELHEFVAFDGSSFMTVKTIGKVANQDLHGTSDVEMVIVAHPDFSAQAERLAEHRRTNDGLSVKVVTPQQIYNEFSSGAQDVAAIRDYMKMIYEKSSDNPKYLLLFGRPSYDYRGRENGNVSYVPNYQFAASLSESSLRANDDYFALLDDGEGSESNGLVDIAVGRFPVATASQAKTVVNKTIEYSKKINLISSSNHSVVSNFDDWKNVISIVADDEDNAHIYAAESAAKIVGDSNRNINLDKIYLDAYKQVSSAGTQSYPEVNEAINLRMNKGSLVFMYVGHSGVKGWAHERVLDFHMISSWQNKYNQPLLLVMGCEFGRYDRNTLSPADRIFINGNGGAVAVVTTSRVAFSGSNQTYADAYFRKMFSKTGSRYPTIGELNMIAKNVYGGYGNGNMNAINMIFVMGDPALKLAMPMLSIRTDSVNGQHINYINDTLKALSKVTVKGSVVDDDGNVVSDFNGNVFPTVFDKKVKLATLQNDAESPYVEFDVQKNALFKGNSTVKDGHFSFSFIVPKDINYNFGNGKLSYYARSQNVDAAGYSTAIVVGGKDTASINDTKGPDIHAYLNDENFVNGGITDQNPMLLLKLKDEYGINTTGNGIGHDIVAILDDRSDNQIVLNDYYITEQDSFNSGTVRYPFKELSVGSHKLKIRAWDILNNPSETTLDFTVVSGDDLTLDHVLNYPNPFTTHTSFFFEHNRQGTSLDIIIQIFTISGHLVKTLESKQATEGNRCLPIEWDGRDDYGDKLAKGTYIYRLRVRDYNGNVAEKFEKLVIL